MASQARTGRSTWVLDGHANVPPVAKSYDDGPAAMLRDAVISCIHDAGLEPVSTRVPLVDLLEPAIEEMDRGSLAGYESWNRFRGVSLPAEKCRPSGAGRVGIRLDDLSDAGSARTRPTEPLSRRAGHGGPAAMRLSSPWSRQRSAGLIEAHKICDVVPNYWPLPVPVGVRRRPGQLVDLDRADKAEPSGLDAEIHAANA